MSETLWKICGAALLGAMLVAVLKKWGTDLASLLRIVSGVVLAVACFGMVTPVVAYLETLAEVSGLGAYLGVLLQVLCVAVLTHLCASVCRDCGEASLAAYVELGGRVEILLLSLPLMRELMDVVTSLLESA